MISRISQCKTVVQQLLCSLILTGILFSCSGGNSSEQENADDMTPEPTESVDYKFTVRIPAGGNAWVKNNAAKTSDLVSDSGIRNWVLTSDVIQVYFATSQAGSLQLGLNAKVQEGVTDLEISLDGTSHEVSVSNQNYKDIPLGVYKDVEPGYHLLELIPKAKTGGYILDVRDILLGDTAASSGVTFIKEAAHFHFGRRGPSDHMSFKIPEDKDIAYFYSEIEVPEGEDKIGSYFMADGFNYGYFGIQVNSETERRVIFSVWSPYSTDDPSEIPEDQKIILLDKGAAVNAGEFGNEGSGGHSHLVYDWKAGNTYKFLLKGEPSVNNSSDYTAWFYAPETGEWQLIASFRRPKTTSYLKGFYSFLENFSPNTGNQERKAYYKNQWVYDITGNWVEITQATFTVDATARAGRRLDYDGGVENGAFYLRNCGFFSDNTAPDTSFTREALGIQPQIDFNALP